MTVASPLDPAQYLWPISSPAIALVTQDPAAHASAPLAATHAPAHGDKALRRSAVPESAAFVRTARNSPDGRKKSLRPCSVMTLASRRRRPQPVDTHAVPPERYSSSARLQEGL
jgi:hypothetical protein